MKFSLRPATEDDPETLAALDAQVQAAGWGALQFASELGKTHSRVWMLTDDETDSVVAGFICFWVIDETCEILSVGIDPTHRRKGYARLMIREAIKDALRAGAERAILNVRTHNEPALQLYQGLGFTTTHIRKQFYSDGDDAYEMELGLEGAKDSF